LTSGTCAIAQWAAVAALEGPQDFIAQSRAAFERRRDLLLARLAKIAGVTCDVPRGAFYAYPSCEAFIGRSTSHGVRIETDEDFVMQLLAHEKVAVVHGGAFGGSPNFRISYAASEQNINDACGRIEHFCSNLK